MASATTTGRQTCPFCGRQLERRDFALPGMRPMPITVPCGCDAARAAAEAEERECEERARDEEFQRVWRRSGVPRRFADVEPDASHDGLLARGGALYIDGENGRGKTTLACAVAKARVLASVRPLGNGRYTHGESLMFVPDYRIVSDVRSTWGRWDVSESDVYARMCGVDLLVLDDLGKSQPGEAATQAVFRIIDERWSAERATVMTSQYGTRELAERMAGGDVALRRNIEGLLSRIRGWCDHVRLEGPDRRLEK